MVFARAVSDVKVALILMALRLKASPKYGPIRNDAADTQDTAVVIIEVKGCWNVGLKTPMKDQLFERYSEDNNCRFGIYLVGWYMCDQWNDADRCKSDTPSWTFEEAHAFFNAQALSISSDVSIEAVVLNTALR